MQPFQQVPEDVKTGEQAASAARGLSPARELAVDVEADAMHAFRARLCFVQVGTDRDIFLFDTLCPGVEATALKALLEDNAPYQARVTFEGEGSATGWNAPGMAPWFEQAVRQASRDGFGADCGYIGQGGTIPLMNMLSKGFPKAQMMVCGVLGPKSNAHGPNEFLHVPYAKRLTVAVAQVIAQMP